MLTTQINDEQCRYLLEILARKPCDAEEKQIDKDNAVKDNRLYRKTPEGLKWYVPKAAKRVVTMYQYDNMGHFTAEKTLKSIKNRYWFPRIKKCVDRYIKACLPYAYNKAPSGRKEGFLHSVEKSSVPVDTMHTDHLGPFGQKAKAILI